MRTRHAIAGCGLSVAILSAAAVPASAQTTGSKVPVSFDVVGGINVSTLSLPIPLPDFEDLGLEFSVGTRVGLIAGVLMGVPAGDGITFETGGLISFKGASAAVTIPELGAATGDISIIYLDVPAIGRFRVARTARMTVAALAGVTMGFKLSAEQSASFMGETITMPIDEGMSSVDLGFTVGGRMEIGRAIVDGRYTFGLLNVANESGPAGETIKNRVLSLMAGWRF